MLGDLRIYCHRSGRRGEEGDPLLLSKLHLNVYESKGARVMGRKVAKQGGC